MFTSVKEILKHNPDRTRLAVLVRALNKVAPNVGSWSGSDNLFPTLFILKSNGADDYKWVLDRVKPDNPKGYTKGKRDAFCKLNGFDPTTVLDKAPGKGSVADILTLLGKDLEAKGIECAFYAKPAATDTSEAGSPILESPVTESQPLIPKEHIVESTVKAKTIPQILAEIKNVCAQHPGFLLAMDQKARKMTINWIPKK